MVIFEHFTAPQMYIRHSTAPEGRLNPRNNSPQPMSPGNQPYVCFEDLPTLPDPARHGNNPAGNRAF
jgi:hypothetical protein